MKGGKVKEGLGRVREAMEMYKWGRVMIGDFRIKIGGSEYEEGRALT